MANVNLVAVIIQEGSRLLSDYLRTKHPKQNFELPPLEYPEFPQIVQPIEIEYIPEGESVPIPASVPLKLQKKEDRLKENATGIKGGCIPCSLGHVGTCTGLLNEAVRFARKEGINEETIDRTGMCLTELNAMERVDLRPEMIVHIPDWEKQMVNELLNESRALRHELEDAVNLTPEKLEALAAKTQSLYNSLNRGYFNKKMDETPNMTPDIKAKINEKLDEVEEMNNKRFQGEDENEEYTDIGT